MSDPITPDENRLYRLDPLCVDDVEVIERLLLDGCLVPAEVDYEAAIEAMRWEGWTCDMHEPDRNCDLCTEMITETVEHVIHAAIGVDDE